jgi:hypothetical protein
MLFWENVTFFKNSDQIYFRRPVHILYLIVKVFC